MSKNTLSSEALEAINRFSDLSYNVQLQYNSYIDLIGKYETYIPASIVSRWATSVNEHIAEIRAFISDTQGLIIDHEAESFTQKSTLLKRE